ncbi:uncharacterized protein LOC110227178 isoform X1 [Arabidopsis lyrata subsp. lyrata]|uniref:uncharacterized protein LOC110227178 isoform X1 n=2 Tax=Arabidopsis lyrata subsp. lyrata TaxID=81972 RepID=UPI000A29B483|nr:uncharacterized protein LOC110227178 isoform X1 [Arabidopsis lyrata subsp. lyrata]|eukprot:XP_020876240.1 uncharacterized protein LOC110227178 isoform X1 [Arabidopsis lyrata subsp. lyrata]
MVNASSSGTSFQHVEEPHINFEHQFDYDHQSHTRFHDMVHDAYHETSTLSDNIEEPNVDAQQFYNMLDAANQPLYDGCREGLSRLSLASRMMNIKTDNNLSEVCMDSWAELISEILPEDNLAAESYYEIQKLVSSLGLPSEMIDVCIDNYMIFWKNDDQLQECRFCGKPRYKPSTGRTKVPYHRMWYLPITDRLKRLYHSERTSASMRWHAEHSRIDGEVTHPSDAKAWQHFNTPLIYELQQLWYTGVSTFDYSEQQNFTMRAVLMWTISDFPAYGMLSGWTTHGRLSCPYCMHRTDAFQLKHGRKTSWFDCHRRFLPVSHPYRKNKKLFTKNKVIRAPPPVYFSGEYLAEQLDYWGAQETAKCGGNWHIPANMPDGYLVDHNWHKKSIFWQLPYWKDLLLRHNLDVMHIEKFFFDNLMYTLLNVQGRSKDNLKTRLDLPDICSRPELHLTRDGKVPVPIFRLFAVAKSTLFEWVKSDVTFPDGYVSKLSRTAEQGQKFSGMKSHDFHVFMQRLLPFAMAELLPRNVHEAIAGIGTFFRDLCTRTLTEEGIHQLDNNIVILLCNLEKIFPPSFFDVMEHLPIHLPHEAALGGPVQFWWMYPFERFMKHLKGKAKNLARVEGSIVAGSLTEETSHFSSYYFAPTVRTRKRAPRRYDDGGVAPVYAVSGVPDIFAQIGRLSGQIKEVWWSSDKDRRSAHTYILLNCDYVQPFESIFVTQVKETFPDVSEKEIEKLKDRDFAGWLKQYVHYGTEIYPVWFHELLQGPITRITTAPMYFTRGYVFHVQAHGQNKATTNYGILVSGGTDYYGVLQEIIEVQYPGLLNLRCILFKCDWYDPVIGRGVRTNNLGVVDVNASRRYQRFEPFILASQAQQVSFIPYPRIRETGVLWLFVIKIAPRGRIIGVSDEIPLQNTQGDIYVPEHTVENIILIDQNNREIEEAGDYSEVEDVDSDEFDENSE